LSSQQEFANFKDDLNLASKQLDALKTKWKYVEILAHRELPVLVRYVCARRIIMNLPEGVSFLYPDLYVDLALEMNSTLMLWPAVTCLLRQQWFESRYFLQKVYDVIRVRGSSGYPDLQEFLLNVSRKQVEPPGNLSSIYYTTDPLPRHLLHLILSGAPVRDDQFMLRQVQNLAEFPIFETNIYVHLALIFELPETLIEASKTSSGRFPAWAEVASSHLPPYDLDSLIRIGALDEVLYIQNNWDGDTSKINGNTILGLWSFFSPAEFRRILASLEDTLFLVTPDTPIEAVRVLKELRPDDSIFMSSRSNSFLTDSKFHQLLELYPYIMDLYDKIDKNSVLLIKNPDLLLLPFEAWPKLQSNQTTDDLCKYMEIWDGSQVLECEHPNLLSYMIMFYRLVLKGAVDPERFPRELINDSLGLYGVLIPAIQEFRVYRDSDFLGWIESLISENANMLLYYKNLLAEDNLVEDLVRFT
jgi:hypothetical protein